MKSQTLTNAILSATLLASLPSAGWGQQCSDWSPKFDQINDSVALRELESERSQGWPNLNPATNGGISLQQGIQQLDQVIQQYQQALQQNQQIWLQVRGSSGPMPNVTSDQCRSMSSASAAMAAACEVANDRNAILAAEGTEDIARCRAGMPAGSYASFPSMGSGGTSAEGLGGGATPWDQGVASVAGLNVSKRAGMVNSVTRNWQPPAEQQAASTSLAQNTTLADPLADTGASGSTSSSVSANSSGSSTTDDVADSDDSAATSANATSDSQWADPLAGDSSAGNREASSTGNPAPPSQAEVSAALDTGTANAAETSLTPVADVPDAANWNSFASSPANSFSGQTTGDSNYSATPDAADKRIDDSLSTLAKEQGDESFSVTAFGPLLHQENKLLNDMNAAGNILFNPTSSAGAGDAADQIISDVVGLGPALVGGVAQAIKNKIQNVIDAVLGDNPGYQLTQKAKNLYQDFSDSVQQVQNIKVGLPAILNFSNSSSSQH
jgi:hypothetical protein